MGDACSGCWPPASSSCWWAEANGNPRLLALGVDPSFGNMEGKEVRFGIANSSIFGAMTTATGCGAVNAMHDSFTPIGGLVTLGNILLGEVIFGGVGCGLYGMLVFVFVAIFIAGLMVGRTPEYLGKKIEARDVKLAALSMLVTSVFVIGGTAWASVADWGSAGLNNAGPHGFSEMLYAFASGTGNNGSAFAGLTMTPANGNVMWNLAQGLSMLVRSAAAGHSGPGARGRARRQEGHAARRRQLPRDRRHVHRPSGEHGPHRGRADLLPRPRGRSHRGALPDGRLDHDLLTFHPFFERHEAHFPMATQSHKRSVLEREILVPALGASFKKLDPRHMVSNPVMFVTEVGAVITTFEVFRASSHGESVGFVIQICLWLWFTVIFANLAEALAEGRGKAQADALRKTRTKTFANRETAPRRDREGLVRGLAKGGRRRGRGRRGHPGRRRGHRRRCDRRRGGHHRGVGACHSRSGRGPLGRHGRHHRALGPHPGSGERRTRARASSTG